jgi:hypothetical protein
MFIVYIIRIRNRRKFYSHQSPRIKKMVGMRKFSHFVEGKGRNEGFLFQLRALCSTSLIHLRCSLPIIPFQRLVFSKYQSSVNSDHQSLPFGKSDGCKLRVYSLLFGNVESLKSLPIFQFFAALSF